MRYGHESTRRRAVICSIGIALVACLALFCGSGTGLAKTGLCCDQYDLDFTTANSRYISDNGTMFSGAPIEAELASLNITSPPKSSNVLVPLPPPGSSTTFARSFDVDFDLSLGAGSPPTHIDSFFDITYRIAYSGTEADGTNDYNTEMLSLNLSGSAASSGGPIPFMIRESPTLPSLGIHTVNFEPDSTYFITSFFDVFTELSLDGGQTFYPAIVPVHLEITAAPEPGTLALAALGAVGLPLVARRKRNLSSDRFCPLPKGGD
jgi:PEP-CTERM motif